MHALTKYICSLGLLLLGSLCQLTALNQLPIETSHNIQQSINENTTRASIKLFAFDSTQNSSDSQCLIYESEEEEEEKHIVLKKHVQFYSFFLAYILSLETNSSSVEDENIIHFCEINTQTAASRCALLQVFLI